MKRVALSLLLFTLLTVGANAIGPTSISIVTDPTGVSYHFDGTSSRGLSREAMAKWFSEGKLWGAEPLRIYIDAATTFFTVSDFITLLKETGRVEHFEIYVTAEVTAESRSLVTYALALGSDQIAPTKREPLLPRGPSLDSSLRSLKPWTQPAPKPSPPAAK